MSTSPSITIRAYQPEDAQALAQIFYHTVHNILCQNYTQQQVDAIAPLEKGQKEAWLDKFAKTEPLVAAVDDQIVGFAELLPDGEIDCFYVHHEWIWCGVGTALMAKIEIIAAQQRLSRLYARVSRTARSFFENKGFTITQTVTVKRLGEVIPNLLMERQL